MPCHCRLLTDIKTSSKTIQAPPHPNTRRWHPHAYHKRKPCTWAAYFDRVNWVHVIKVTSHEVTTLGWQGSDLPAGHSCPLSSCCYLHAWVVGHCDLAAGSAWLLHSVSRFLALPTTKGEEALANHGPFCFWTQYVSKTWKSNNKLV